MSWTIAQYCPEPTIVSLITPPHPPPSPFPIMAVETALLPLPDLDLFASPAEDNHLASPAEDNLFASPAEDNLFGQPAADNLFGPPAEDNLFGPPAGGTGVSPASAPLVFDGEGTFPSIDDDESHTHELDLTGTAINPVENYVYAIAQGNSITATASLPAKNGQYATVHQFLEAHGFTPSCLGWQHIVSAATLMLNQKTPVKVRVPGCTDVQYASGMGADISTRVGKFSPPGCYIISGRPVLIAYGGTSVYVTDKQKGTCETVRSWWDIATAAKQPIRKSKGHDTCFQMYNPTMLLFNSEEDKNTAMSAFNDTNSMLELTNHTERLYVLPISAGYTCRKHDVFSGVEVNPLVYVVLWTSSSDYTAVDLLLEAHNTQTFRPAGGLCNVNTGTSVYKVMSPAHTTLRGITTEALAAFADRVSEAASDVLPKISHLLGIPSINNLSPLDPLYEAKIAANEASKPMLKSVEQAWRAICSDTATFPGSKTTLWSQFSNAVDTHFSSRDDSPRQRQLKHEAMIIDMIYAKVETSRKTLQDVQGSVQALVSKQIQLISSSSASPEQEKALHTEMGILLDQKAARQTELERQKADLAEHEALRDALTKTTNQLQKAHDTIDKRNAEISDLEHRASKSARTIRQRSAARNATVQ